MTVKHEYEFNSEAMQNMMDKKLRNQPKKALKRWASHNYPLGGVYSIFDITVNKDNSASITIIER